MIVTKKNLLLILFALFFIFSLQLSTKPTNVAHATGTNLALNKLGTSNVSSCSTGESPAQALDANLNTHWCSTVAGTKWLTIDLGTVTTFNRWVVKHAQTGGEDPNLNTKDFKLQTSTDGINFTDKDMLTGNTASITNRIISSTSVRYVRLYVTTPNQVIGDNTVRIREFELYNDTVPSSNNVYVFDIANYLRNNTKAVYPLDTSDGTPIGRYVMLKVPKPNGYATDNTARVPEIELYNNLAFGKIVTATDSNSAGEGPANAVDNSTDTHWCSTSTGDRWLSVDLGTTKTIKRWVVKNAQTGGEASNLNTKNYKLQVSTNGTTFTDVDTVTDNTAALTERTIAGTSGRYFRLYITTPNQISGDNVVRIRDFELYDAGNIALNTTVTSSSGVNPSYATDGNLNTQWASTSSDTDIWIKIDLGSVKSFNRWVVKNASAAGQSTNNNLFGYNLSVSSDDSFGSYLQVDAVDLNTADITDRMVSRKTFVKYKKYAYDFMKMAATFQGIVNRGGTNVFFKYEGSSEINKPRNFDPDSYWLNKIGQSGQILAGKTQITVTDFYSLLNIFSYKIAGMVTWDDAVPSTSNVASTVAGVEDLLPVRYDRGTNSLYTEMKALTTLDVGVHLENKFTGSGTIWNTTTVSTGSKKNDAYIWVKQKYLDTHKVSASLMQFAVDAWINPTNSAEFKDSTGTPYYSDLFNRMIINQDYYIKNKAFFFDLQPRNDYLPNDDPTQSMGTDYNTLDQIMSSMETYSNGTMFTVGGFTAWHIKYTTAVDPNGMAPIDSEWDMTTMLSSHNGQLDADAPGLMALANASIYSQISLNTLVQNNDKGANNTEVYDPNKRYILFYMGDYDSAAWAGSELPALWDSANGRGSIPLAWSVVPGLSQRIPMLYNYLYSTATPKDYFVAGDNGAGYLNPIDLPSQYHTAWKNTTKNYFNLFDLTIAGFVIPQWDPLIPSNIQQEYAEIAPNGVGTPGEFNVVNGVPFFPINQGISAYNANAVEKGLLDMINNQPNAHFYNIRTVLADPRYITNGAQQFLANHADKNAEVVDPYTFYRLVNQYYSKDIRWADLNTDGGKNELMYLSNNSGSTISTDHRVADFNNSMTYKIDLEDNVKSAKMLLDIQGDYVVSASKDNTNWTDLLVAGEIVARTTKELDITPMLFNNSSKIVYIKFKDGTPATGSGATLYHLNLNTNFIQAADFNVDGGSAEAPFLYKNFANQQPGFKFADKKALFEYKFSLEPTATHASVNLDIWGNYLISASTDDVTWTQIAAAGTYASRNWLNLDLSNLLVNNPQKTIYLKFTDSTKNGGGPALAHVTLNSTYDSIDTDTKNSYKEIPLLSTDSGSNISGDHRFADGTAYWVYKLNFSNSTNYAQADLTIAGDYVVSGSRDGINWTDIKQKGSYASTENISLELSPFLLGNSTKIVYLKFSDRTPLDGGGPSLVHMNAYAKSTGSYGTFRLMNKWKGTYMNIENLNGKTEVNGNNWGDSSKWTFEDAGNGYYRIKNYWKNGYSLNIENLLGYVQYGTVTSTQDSAMWLLTDVSGFNRFTNKWQSSATIHIENNLGYAEYGNLIGDSSQWLLVPVYS